MSRCGGMRKRWRGSGFGRRKKSEKPRRLHEGRGQKSWQLRQRRWLHKRLRLLLRQLAMLQKP